MHNIATFEQLFAAAHSRRYQEFTLPISGLAVRIQSLTERELSAYESETIAEKGQGLRKSKLEDARRRLIAKCLVDPAGNRLMRDDQAGRIADWDSVDAAVCYDRCGEHVGVKREDVEGLVKNSAETSVVS